MKRLIILISFLFILFFNGMTLYGQGNHKPAFYLNSKPIDFDKVFLNPERVDSVKMEKNSMGGKFMIFTKKSEFTFYRLADILKKYTKIKGPMPFIIYIINGIVLKDTTSVEIDDTYFITSVY